MTLGLLILFSILLWATASTSAAATPKLKGTRRRKAQGVAKGEPTAVKKCKDKKAKNAVTNGENLPWCDEPKKRTAQECAELKAGKVPHHVPDGKQHKMKDGIRLELKTESETVLKEVHHTLQHTVSYRAAGCKADNEKEPPAANRRLQTEEAASMATDEVPQISGIHFHPLQIQGNDGKCYWLLLVPSCAIFSHPAISQRPQNYVVCAQGSSNECKVAMAPLDIHYESEKKATKEQQNLMIGAVLNTIVAVQLEEGDGGSLAVISSMKSTGGIAPTNSTAGGGTRGSLIGGTLAAVIIVALGAYLFSRKRLNRRASTSEEHNGNSSVKDPRESSKMNGKPGDAAISPRVTFDPTLDDATVQSSDGSSGEASILDQNPESNQASTKAIASKSQPAPSTSTAVAAPTDPTSALSLPSFLTCFDMQPCGYYTAQ